VSGLDRLVRAVDPALAAHAAAEPGPGRFAGSSRDSEAELVLEAVYEGYLAHYDSPRAFERLDDDLRLLAGDALYALGLERLAAGGDLDAVTELAELIAGCARAEAEQHRDDARELWRASVPSLTH